MKATCINHKETAVIAVCPATNTSSLTTVFMRNLYTKLLMGLLLFCGVLGANAQVVNVDIPTNTVPKLLSTYPSLAKAIAAVNTRNSISGPVTLTLVSDQIAPPGGYIIQNTSITGLSATNRITFNGDGQVILSGAGVSTTNDAIFKIIGTDYITLKNFSMGDVSSNLSQTLQVEWGIAILYATPTNGSQNIMIQNNFIFLNRNNVNTFGIYSNSTHSPTVVGTTVSATGAGGGNSGLTIIGNDIVNVNHGIVVVGPLAAADQNDGITVGGSALDANEIFDYGTTATFPGYAHVPASVNGILVSNSKNVNVSFNTVSSSAGGVISGTLNGIQLLSSSATPTGTFTQNINSNTISLRSGNAIGAMTGIFLGTGIGNATSTVNINSNNFNNFGSTVPGSGTTMFINSLTGAQALTTNINSNQFDSMSVNTTGNVTFINRSGSMPFGSSENVNNNVVSGFSKTRGGGSVVFYNGQALSVNGAIMTQTGNICRNVSIIGTTTFTGIANREGAGSANGPTKIITGNEFNNITASATPTGSLTGFNINNSGLNTTVSRNTITNFTGGAAIVGINYGSNNGQGKHFLDSNVINGLTHIGGGTGIVNGIQAGAANVAEQEINYNKISGLSNTGPSTTNGIVTVGGGYNLIGSNDICNIQAGHVLGGSSGITVTAGDTNVILINRISNLHAPFANAVNPINGINITATNGFAWVVANTVHLAATRVSGGGGVFGSTAINANTGPLLRMVSNIFSNTSDFFGAGGLTVAYRRSSSTLTTYLPACDGNNYYAPVIFTDGSTIITDIDIYKAFVALPSIGRDTRSISVVTNFLSTICGDSNSLTINPAIPTELESGGISDPDFTVDFENEPRWNTPGYVGTGTHPDIGADEFEGIRPAACSGTPPASAIVGANEVCSNTGTILSLNIIYTAPGITYQWASGTTPGGPYPNMLGPGATQATGNLTVPTYFQCIITCTNGGATFTTSEKEVTILALPTLTVSQSSAIYCSPGGTSVTLTAGGASTYTWAPTSGLSPTTGAAVAASPAESTTYTVTGTAANGCVNTTQAFITVGPLPQNVTVTASPASVCSGNTSTLTATVGSSISANTLSALNAETYTTLSGAGITTINTNAGLSVSMSNDQDDGAALITLPFTFSYLGNTFTQMTMCTNGWVGAGNQLAVTALDGRTAANLFSTTAPNNFIAAWFKDMGANFPLGTGSMRHGLIDTDIYAFQWDKAVGNGFSDGSANTISFQINIHGPASATPGRIEYIYGPTVGAITATAAAIGVENATGGTNNYINFLTGTGTSTTTSTVWPGTGNGYSLDPIVPTYSWTPAPSVVNPTAATTSTIPLTATQTFNVLVSYGSCSVNASTSVVVNPLTAVNISTTGALCTGVNFTATVNTFGGSPAYNYVWSDGTATVYPNAQTITVNLPAGSHNLTVNVTETCGGNITMSLPITVNALPTVTVVPSASTICIPGGSAVSLTASGADTFSWLPTAGLTPATGATVLALPAFTTTYTVAGTGVNGCINTATALITVTIIPQNVVATATPPSVCLNAASTLSVTSVIPFIASTYSFTHTAAAGSLDAMIGATTVVASGVDDQPMSPDDINAGNAAPIGFNVFFEGVSYSHYSASPDGWIKFSNSTTPAVLQFTNAVTSTTNIPKIYPFWDDLATGSNGNVKALVTGTAPNRIFKLQWFVTIPRALAGAANSTFQAWVFEVDSRIEYRYGAMGNPTSGSSSGGMTGAVSTNFHSLTYVGHLSNIATANNSNTTAPPAGTLYTYAPQVALLSYAWSPASRVVNPTAQTTLTQPISTLTESFSVLVSNGTCAAAPATVSVTTNPLTAVSITTTGSLCAGTNFTATANTTGGLPVYNYAWSDGSATVYPNAATVTVNLAAGSRTLSVTVSDGCGSAVIMSLPVVVNAPPVVSVTPSTGSICLPGGAPISLTASGATNYTWTPVGGLDVTTGPTVSAIPSETTTYTVTGTAGNGCIGTASAMITVGYTPVNTSAAINPNPVCAGSPINLTSSVLMPGYTIVNNSGVTFQDISGTGTAVVGIEDDSQHAIVFPAPFVYNGVSYTGARVSNNGTLIMGTGNVSTSGGFDNLALPAPASAFGTLSTNTSAAVICAYWDDLINGTGPATTIRTELVGSKFIVQWTGEQHFDIQTSNRITFQIQLEQGTNKIHLVYQDVDLGVPANNNGASATIGLNFSATSAMQHSFNTAGVINGQSITYTPNAPTYSWTGPNGFTSALQNPVIATGTAAAAGVYTVTFTGTGGCTSTASTPALVVNSCGSDITVTAFLEGLYLGGSTMINNLEIAGVAGATSLQADTVEINLWDPTDLLSPTPHHSQRVVISTSGVAVATFPGVTGNWWVALKHRNHLETWSAAPINMVPATILNFSTNMSAAFADINSTNTPMKVMADGKLAFYGGDVDQDGTVAGSDMNEVDNGTAAFEFGYNRADCNGNGETSGGDMDIVDNNTNLFLFYARPF